MPQEGAGMDRFAFGGRPGTVHQFRPAHARRERETARQSFAQANDIRDDARVFASKPSPRATESGVDLIQNQQGAELITEPPQQNQEFGWWNVNPTADLDWFHQDCPNGPAPQS